MATTAAQTKADLDRMKRQVAGLNADMMVGVTQDAYESITIGHPATGAPGQPVDTGYLRQSWSLFTDAPSFNTNGDGTDNAGTTQNPTPRKVPNPAVLIELAMGKAHKVTIATNTAYAEVQEWKHATKSGSVRLTIAGLGALASRRFAAARRALASVR